MLSAATFAVRSVEHPKERVAYIGGRRRAISADQAQVLSLDVHVLIQERLHVAGRTVP